MGAGVVVVSTNSDAATSVLSGYARTLVCEAPALISAHLHNEPASRVRVILARSAVAGVFFFAHGREVPAEIVDHQGAAMLDGRTLHLLGTLAVCAACYSLDHLADGAVKLGTTIIRYSSELLLPMKAGYASEMENAALAAQRALLRGSRARDAAQSAEESYRELARSWYKRPSLTALIYAALAESNADAMGVKGDDRVTL